MITVILHTPEGDVRTSFPEDWFDAMMACVDAYIKTGKKFTIEHS